MNQAIHKHTTGFNVLIGTPLDVLSTSGAHIAVRGAVNGFRPRRDNQNYGTGGHLDVGRKRFLWATATGHLLDASSDSPIRLAIVTFVTFFAIPGRRNI
jgi:hypothetical protein